MEAIVRTNDSNTIFNEIISRKDSLEDSVDNLEQLETFYKDGSNQQKVFEEAQEIVYWYNQNNTLFADLSAISDTINQMCNILTLDVPFAKMTELGNLILMLKKLKRKYFKIN